MPPIAARLRQETTLSIKQIAERLHLGKPKGAKTNLHKRLNHPAPTNSGFQLWGLMNYAPKNIRFYGLTPPTLP